MVQLFGKKSHFNPKLREKKSKNIIKLNQGFLRYLIDKAWQVPLQLITNLFDGSMLRFSNDLVFQLEPIAFENLHEKSNNFFP